MMAVEPGIDALALGEMGIGNTTVAAALCAGLFGGDAADCGPGPAPGSPAPRSTAKREVGRRGGRAPPRRRRAIRSTCCAGSAGSNSPRSPARSWRRGMGRVPVVLDGFASTAAAAVLFAADPRALDHCVVGARLGRAGPPPAARADRQAAAARSRHAARRSVGRDARARAAEGGGRLPHRHGDLRRGRRQRARLMPRRGVCGTVPRAAQAVAAIERGPSGRPAR